jgi:hypothetical protein
VILNDQDTERSRAEATQSVIGPVADTYRVSFNSQFIDNNYGKNGPQAINVFNNNLATTAASIINSPA